MATDPNQARDRVTRFDAAHTRAAAPPDGEPAPQNLIAAAAGQDPEAAQDQLRLQAGQLAAHLRERERELDQREAQLNSRQAELENELRATRLWLRERERDLEARQQQGGPLATPVGPSAGTKPAVDQGPNFEALEERAVIAEMIERLEQRAAALRRQRDEMQEWIAERRAELDERARQLAERETELRADRKQLEQLRHEHYTRRDRQPRRLA